MSKTDGDKVINFIQNKWQNQICPLCYGKSWNVAEKVFELREFNDGDLHVGGPNASIVPVIPVICENCGNTIFINALSTGLIKKE